MSDAGGAMLSLGSAAATNGVPNPLPQLSSVLHALAQRICRCEMQNTEIQDEKWQIQNQLRPMESLASAVAALVQYADNVLGSLPYNMIEIQNKVS